MNAMPPDARSAAPAWLDEWRARASRRRRRGSLTWLRHQTDGPYWRPGSLAPDYDAIDVGDPSTSADGAMPTWTRRSGCRPAARLHHGPSWATGSTAGRTIPRPDPTSTSSTRSCGSSTAGSRANRTDPTRNPRSSGSSGTTPRRSRSPTRGRVAGERRPRSRTRPPRSRVAVRRQVPAARRQAGAPGAGAARGDQGSGVDRYPAPRPSARAGRCRGARAGSRTGSPATCVGRGRRTRPIRAIPEPSRTVEILGEPVAVLHLSVSAPVATAVVRLTDVAPDGTSSQVSAGILNLTHRRSDPSPRPSTRARGGDPGPVAAPWATGSNPATGSASRSARRPGRSSGRRPIPRPSTCTVDRRRPRGLRPPRGPGGRRPGRPAAPGLQDDPATDLRAVGGDGPPTRRCGASRRTSSPARSRSRSTMAARTSSRTAGACTPPRPCG